MYRDTHYNELDDCGRQVGDDNDEGKRWYLLGIRTAALRVGDSIKRHFLQYSNVQPPYVYSVYIVRSNRQREQMPEGGKKRRRGRPTIRWEDYVKRMGGEWTGEWKTKQKIEEVGYC